MGFRIVLDEDLCQCHGVCEGEAPEIFEVKKHQLIIHNVEPGEFYVPNPVEVVVGGATMFVVPVERYERLGVS